MLSTNITFNRQPQLPIKRSARISDDGPFSQSETSAVIPGFRYWTDGTQTPHGSSTGTTLVPAISGTLVAGTSMNMLHVAGNMTSEQLAHELNLIGVRPDLTLPYANQIMGFYTANQHGINTILVGVAAGGGTYAFLGWLRPRMSQTLRLLIASSVAVTIIFLLLYFGRGSNPFVGTWIENVAQSRYETGAPPPRAATLTITEESNGLRVKEDEVLTAGDQRHLSYLVNSDRTEHPDPTGVGNTIGVITKDNSLFEIVHRSGKVEVGRDNWALSPDQKLLTITRAGHLGGGAKYTNVLVFDRK